MKDKQSRKFVFTFLPLLFLLSSFFWCGLSYTALAIICAVVGTGLLVYGVFAGDAKLFG